MSVLDEAKLKVNLVKLSLNNVMIDNDFIQLSDAI